MPGQEIQGTKAIYESGYLQYIQYTAGILCMYSMFLGCKCIYTAFKPGYILYTVHGLKFPVSDG